MIAQVSLLVSLNKPIDMHNTVSCGLRGFAYLITFVIACFESYVSARHA
jgi:hypothetical protein